MKLVRRFALAVALLLVLRAYTGGFSEGLTVRVQKLVEQQGIPCSVESVGVGFIWRLKIGRLSCRLGEQSLDLTDLSLSPKLSGLIKLMPGFEVRGKALPGVFAIELMRSVRTGESFVSAEFNGILIENLPRIHPRVDASGVLEGVFTGDLARGGGSIRISGLAVKAKSGLLKLPELDGGELVAQIGLKDGVLNLDPLTLRSSLGEADGVVELNLSRRSYDGKVQLRLSGTGVAGVGGFLAMAAGGHVENPGESWQIDLSGSLSSGSPSVSVQEIK
jgi:hypothetical protein